MPRLLSCGLRGRRRRRAGRAEARCRRTVPVHLPAPAARPVPGHRRLHQIAGTGHRAQPGGRVAVPAGHHGAADRRLRQQTVRVRLLPRLLGGARHRRAAHRGTRRVLAPPHPRGTEVHRSRCQPRIPNRSRSTSSSDTAVPVSRSARVRARTSRTGRRLWSCSSPVASASNRPRNFSCTRSSPPTHSCFTTPRRSTSTSKRQRLDPSSLLAKSPALRAAHCATDSAGVPVSSATSRLAC